MQKFILIILFINVAYSNLISQEPCDPTQTLFEDVAPIWRHYIVDSTMIGYPDPDPNINYVYSGDDHLEFDIGSFVQGEFLYGITQIILTGDIAGALIEKINLETGELIWQISNDLRESVYREKVLDARVEGDMFIVSGIREDISNEQSLQLAEVAFVAKSEGKIFERVYDLETGQQISYDTPIQEDSLAFNLSFTPWLYYNFFDEQEVENFLDAKNFVTGNESYLIRRRIDETGRLVSGPDTVVVGRFNGRLINDAIWQAGPRLRKKEDGNFLYVEQYSPLPKIDQTFEAFISEYDKDYNLIRERNLKDFGLEEFSLIQIIKTTPEYIFLRGCYNVENQNVTACGAFCLVLDHSLDLIDQFDLIDAAEEQYQIGLNNFSRGTNEAFYITSIDFTFDSVSVSTNHILRSTPDGILEAFQSFRGINANRLTAITFMEVLDNGDFLLQLRHNCFEEGVIGTVGSFQEWVRMDADDFILSISQINTAFKYEVGPNPFIDYIEMYNLDGDISEVTITNLNGIVVKTQKVIGAQKLRLDTSNLESGFYFISVVNKNKEVSSTGIVKL
jgi:hypothetical protein